VTRAHPLPVLILASLAARPAPAAPATPPEPRAGFVLLPSARVWLTPLHGEASADTNLVYGTGLDLRSDLGMSGTSPFVELGLAFAGWDAFMPGHRFVYGLEARGLWGEWQGRSTLDASTTFDGSVYPAGDAVKSTFATDLTFIHATGYWELQSDPLVFQLGFFGGIAILGASLEVDGQAGGKEEDALRKAPVGGGIRFSVSPVPWLDAGFDAAYYGMFLGVDDYDWDEFEEYGQLIDLSACVRLRPWRHAALEVGYRFLDAELSEMQQDDDFLTTGRRNETEFSWRMQGWFVGGVFRF
jgi:hypothetical protein